MPPSTTSATSAAAVARRLAGTRTVGTRTISTRSAPAFRLANRLAPAPARAPASALFARTVSAATTATPRCYHSYDHPNTPPAQDAFSAAETAILTAAARHIPAHGFSERTLGLGAYDAGYPGISTSILPDGVFSLVRWHLVGQRTALAARSQDIYGGEGEAEEENSGNRPREEIATRAERLLWERLLANGPVIARWQEALAIMAQPSHVAASLRELALLADEVWALAGDRAVDPTWYAKRTAVSAAYAASELFMTTDTSADYAATRAFLHRRFQESSDLGGAVRSVTEFVGFAASAGVNVLRSKGLNI